APRRSMINLEKARRGVVRVGSGRGFVVEGKLGLFIVTAAHCLKIRIPCASFAVPLERICRRLGHLGERKKPTVWGECCFIDPIADIAVLQQPDPEVFCEHSEEWDAMVDQTTPFPLSEEPAKAKAWFLSLDCRWSACEVERFGHSLVVEELAEEIQPGM